MEQRYLADSNTIIDYIGNRMPEKALLVLDKYLNQNFTISIISKIEVLGYNNDEKGIQLLSDFIQLANVVFVDDLIADKTIELRKKNTK